MLTAFVAIFAGWLVLCVTARLAYPRLLFPAPRLDAVPASVKEKIGAAGGPTLVHDGALRALHYATPRPGARTAVLFHGNGETMFDGMWAAEELTRRGLGVVLVEYRGYGLAYGPPPSEAMLYEDGENALAWLAKQGVGNDRIAIWGTSLGTSVAAEMARRGHGRRLVLLAPFTSAVAMGQHFAPFLPARLVMAHRLDTLSKAKEISVPTLIVHGTDDEVVPFAMGERLSRELPHAELLRIPLGHHNDLLSKAGVLDAIATHLRAE